LELQIGVKITVNAGAQSMIYSYTASEHVNNPFEVSEERLLTLSLQAHVYMTHIF